MKPQAVALIAFVVVVVVALVFVARPSEVPSRPVPASDATTPTPPNARLAVPVPPPSASKDPLPLSSAASSPPLASPHGTVATQLALLEKGSDADFRRTFLPSVQPELTSDAIARCREWMRDRTVKPHWAMAEESTEEGTRVVRVSMFGKSLTGFHESPSGKWLADAVWCLPPGP